MVAANGTTGNGTTGNGRTDSVGSGPLFEEAPRRQRPRGAALYVLTAVVAFALGVLVTLTVTYNRSARELTAVKASLDLAHLSRFVIFGEHVRILEANFKAAQATNARLVELYSNKIGSSTELQSLLTHLQELEPHAEKQLGELQVRVKELEAALEGDDEAFDSAAKDLPLTPIEEWPSPQAYIVMNGRFAELLQH